MATAVPQSKPSGGTTVANTTGLNAHGIGAPAGGFQNSAGLFGGGVYVGGDSNPNVVTVIKDSESNEEWTVNGVVPENAEYIRDPVTGELQVVYASATAPQTNSMPIQNAQQQMPQQQQMQQVQQPQETYAARVGMQQTARGPLPAQAPAPVNVQAQPQQQQQMQVAAAPAPPNVQQQIVAAAANIPMQPASCHNERQKRGHVHIGSTYTTIKVPLTVSFSGRLGAKTTLSSSISGKQLLQYLAGALQRASPETKARGVEALLGGLDLTHTCIYKLLFKGDKHSGFSRAAAMRCTTSGMEALNTRPRPNGGSKYICSFPPTFSTHGKEKLYNRSELLDSELFNKFGGDSSIRIHKDLEYWDEEDLIGIPVESSFLEVITAPENAALICKKVPDWKGGYTSRCHKGRNYNVFPSNVVNEGLAVYMQQHDECISLLDLTGGVTFELEALHGGNTGVDTDYEADAYIELLACICLPRSSTGVENRPVVTRQKRNLREESLRMLAARKKAPTRA